MDVRGTCFEGESGLIAVIPPALIRDYNKALPKRRRGKDDMTDPVTSNITATFTVKKDLKKKTLELVPHFHPVGMVDGYRPSSVSINPFSLLNRQNEI